MVAMIVAVGDGWADYSIRPELMIEERRDASVEIMAILLEQKGMRLV